MSGLCFTSISVRYGGGDGGTVGSRGRWAVKGRAILCFLLGIGCDETTKIMSSVHLIVGYIEEDWEDRSVRERHAIVGWFHGNVTKSFGGLFEHR